MKHHGKNEQCIVQDQITTRHCVGIIIRIILQQLEDLLIAASATMAQSMARSLPLPSVVPSHCTRCAPPSPSRPPRRTNRFVRELPPPPLWSPKPTLPLVRPPPPPLSFVAVRAAVARERRERPAGGGWWSDGGEVSLLEGGGGVPMQTRPRSGGAVQPWNWPDVEAG